MKKIAFLCLSLLLALSSCNYETKAYKALKHQNDSIQAVQARQMADLDNYLSLIQEVDSGFDLIREQQNYVNMSYNAEGTPNDDMRRRMAENFTMIRNIMDENKSKIEDLEQKLSASGMQSAQLRKTIQRLNETLEQKSQEMTQLRQELEQRDFKIDSLLMENEMMQQSNADLTAQGESQRQQIQDQDVQLHRAYYWMATRKEIKNNNVDAKKMTTSFRTSLFTAVDIREFDRLDTHSKSAKILTKHPMGSYTLEKGSDKTYSIIILNSEDFWSVSKYLLVQID